MKQDVDYMQLIDYVVEFISVLIDSLPVESVHFSQKGGEVSNDHGRIPSLSLQHYWFCLMLCR